jgi:hypothetical protein
MAAEHVLHMQKALDQMNLQIHRVLNDVTGVSGLKVPDAILAGERDPLLLARLCHGGVKNSEDTIAKSLEGDYRPEHLFALRQSLAAYRYYRQLVVEGKQEIKLQLGALKTATTAEATIPARTKVSCRLLLRTSKTTTSLRPVRVCCDEQSAFHSELVLVRLTEVLIRNDTLDPVLAYRQPCASLGACRWV